jgi:hypothetical protein
MWDEKKRQRFQELRRQQEELHLTEAGQAELARLIEELQADEAAYLTAALQRMRQESQVLESQNRRLERLARRKETLAVRLREFVAEAQAERRAIEHELAAVLAGSSDAHSEE